MRQMQLPAAVTTDDALEVPSRRERIVIVRVHRAGLAGDQVPDVLAIDRIARRRRTRQVRDGGQQIERTPRALRNRTALDAARKPHRAGAADSPVEARTLGLAVRRRAGMVPVGSPRSVVRCEEDEGVVLHTSGFQRPGDLADRPVDLHHDIAIQSGTGLTPELVAAEQRHMRH